MLTGKRAFDGEAATEVIAAVSRAEADWPAIADSIPPHLRTLVTRCLEKNRKARIGDIAVARFLLESPVESDALRLARPEPVEGRARARQTVAWRGVLP